MPNLFDGIRKLTDEELKTEIALISQVSLANAARETGNRVLGSLAGFANAFTETLGQKAPLEYEVVRVSDMVRRARAGLEGKDRIQLEYELKQQIAAKCGISSEEAEAAGEERLAFLLLNEAARSYNIQKYATPANKTEEICIEYNSALLGHLHSWLVRQRGAQAAECDKNIQKRLNEVPIESKRALQERLLPKEFSGKGIGRILRLERGTRYLEDTVECLGLECFDGIQVYVGTALSALMNLKRVSWVVLAHLVWKARTAFNEKFTIDRSLLPSYIPPEMLAKHNGQEAAFRELMRQRTLAKEQLAKCDSALDKHDEAVARTQEKLELEKREYDEQQMAFMGLESRKDLFNRGLKPENETKKYYSEVNETMRRIERIQAECEKQAKKLDVLAERGKKLEAERDTARINMEVIMHKTQEQMSEFTDEVSRNWKAYYYKFTFEDEIFAQVVEKFTAQERLCIEEILKEVHECKNTQAYEANAEHQVCCYLSSGKNAAITMEGMHVCGIERK